MISKNFNKIFQLILVLICCFVCTPETALADGIYIPEIAYAKLPDMPFQRAVLTYRDGIETLIIESSLEAEGKSFGWIIPLPAVPTKLKEVSPGFLKTMTECIQPRISHDQIQLGYVIFYAVIITLAVFYYIFGRKKSSKGCSWIIVTAILLFFFAGLGIGSLTSFGGFGHIKTYHKTPGINIYSDSQVGNYNVAVLNADNANVLDSWLSTNGFAKIPEAGKHIVADYITNGWCFVTAKLHREGSGFSSPHPLLMSFQTKRPVYPMKLTALADSELYLELFVCADKRAEAKGLELSYCDRHINKEFYVLRQKFWGYLGENYYRRMYHPFAKNILWTNCVITKLSAKLTPEQMNKDFEIEFESFEPFIQHFYSFRGAIKKGVLISLLIWSAGLIVALLSYSFRKRFKKDISHPMGRFILPLFCTSIFVGLFIVITVPKIKVVTGKNYRNPRYHLVDTHKLAMKFINEQPAIITNETKIIEQKLVNYFKNEKWENSFTGEPIKAEDSPGNFTIIRNNENLDLIVYYINGAPVKKRLTFEPLNF